MNERPPLRVLHTSDWHLGKMLYGRSRHREFEQFLDWLASLLETESVDILLVAGDVFDSTTPGTRAQELYYRFISRVARSSCRHVVVTSGNHDSPSFLNAPKLLLRSLNVHVVGSVAESPEEEVLVLRDGGGCAEAVICAVPYLRERDIRTVEAGESPDDKTRKLAEGIGRHYAEVVRIAEAARSGNGMGVPLVVMGHLFAAGPDSSGKEGVRGTFVGTLAQVDSSVFPDGIDFAALGHLHGARTVSGREHLRYSGSPIPMVFGEAATGKSVVLASWSGGAFSFSEIPVPCFQPLVRISGSLDEISARIFELKAGGSNAWLEIDYTGQEPSSKVKETLDGAVRGTDIEIRRVRNSQVAMQVMRQLAADELLEELQEEEVFRRCLEARKVPEEQHPELMHCYLDILASMRGEDPQAEPEDGA